MSEEKSKRSTISRAQGFLADIRLSGNREMERKQVIVALCNLFEEIEQISESIIPLEAHQTLSVKVYPWIPDQQQHQAPNFFHPWSVSQAEGYPKNLESPNAQEDLDTIEHVLKEGDPIVRLFGGTYKTWRWAREMCYRLMWEVDIAPRMGTEGNSRPLKSISGWRFSEACPLAEFFLPYFIGQEDHFHPVYTWSPPGKDIPHMKICMYHDIKGHPGCILREEMLTIIGAMVTRLLEEKFKKHIVVPIMLFSFMGERHGRILLAHFSGSELIIRMSQLYRFHALDADNLFLFTRYLAGDIDSRVKTKSLPSTEASEFS